MIIEFVNVSYRYNTIRQTGRLALDNISFAIHENERVGIIGPTGSGKTTLLQMFTGLLKPTAGVVLVDGQNIHDKNYEVERLRQQIGIVFQFPENQLFEETVFDDVAFGPKNMGIREAELSDRVNVSLKRVGIEDESIEQMSPHVLSDGQKRKVAIAGILAMHPQILIMDEPTACLDAAGIAAISRLIAELHQLGKTIIVVSHHMDFVAANCERIIALNSGKVQFDGEKRALFAEPELFERLALPVPIALRMAKRLKRMGYLESDDIYSRDDLLKCLTD